MKTAEVFSTGDSYIHTLDPRLRLLFCFILSMIIALSESYKVLGMSLVVALVLIGLARLDLRVVFSRLSTILGFLVLIWVMLPFTFEGEILARIGILKLYRPGVELSAAISLKSCTILLVFISLVATMPVSTLGDVLYFYRLPVKFVFLLVITYRYIFVISEEYTRLRNAMRIRGFKAATNVHSFRTIAYLVGMLLVRASLRARRVNQAMLLRGFQGRFYSLEEFDQYHRPWVFSLLMAGFSVLLVALEGRRL